MNSFSNEWIGYNYDGVIWDLSYEDHEKRFLAEIGPAARAHGRGGLFLEIGCGMGLTTFFASKNMRCDSLGVDLSLAVLRASQHFEANPFLHFLQGSAFYLPVRRSLASVTYSHGVLHHTYSTAKAVASVARHCGQGGWLYLWLYGTGSKKGSIARRIAYALEEALRPVIARNLKSLPSRAALAAMGYAYRLINVLHRFRDSSVEKYDYNKALHAARDRFTPLYAHRQDFAEVAGWLTSLGFENVEEVDWRTMPTANQDNYRRNTGVRGRRAKA
jgi:SAM-dependent methyltransferase